MSGKRRLSIPSMGDYSDNLYKVSNIDYHVKSAHQSSPIIGIIGTSAFYSEADAKQLMITVTELWGKPARILFAQDKGLSMYIDLWAEANKVEPVPLEANWKTAGPRACQERNRRIEKESTHFIIVRSPRSRSDASLRKAEYLSKKKEVIILQGYDTEAPTPKTLLLDHLVPPPQKITKDSSHPSSSNNKQTLMNFFKPSKPIQK